MGSDLVQSGILAAPVQIVLDKLATFAQNEIALILDAEDEFKKLKRAVLKVEALVDSVKTKQQRWCYSSQRAFQLWLRDLQRVLHDADDLLDDIDIELMKFNSNIDIVGLTIEDEVRNLVFSELKLGIPHEMAKIRRRLEDMAREMESLFMNEILYMTQPNLIGKLQTSSLVNESLVIGREKDKDEIIRMLSLEETGEDDISVISIVGMAGVGKTTLAQLVYNDEQVVNHFPNSRIWVSISIEDTVQMITKSIFDSTTPVPFRLRASDLDTIQTRLQSTLSTRKFLIVLDGMWSENASDWDVLCLPLKVAARGSRILVTTRSMIVSRIVSTTPAYRVQTLSDEECWDLMKKRALSCINEYEPREVEEAGLKIAQKCKGLPLAARVIGSILRIKSDEMEWNDLLKSKLWNLEDGANEILSALKLSYDHLPPLLKRCFSYCSIFPQNFEFKTDELVQLWVAEGFIQQRATRRTEDIGKDYFNLLLSRSLFQFSHADHNSHPIYKMHGLMHELAQFVSDELCFRMEDDVSQPWPNLKSTKHSSLVCKDIQPQTWKVFHKCIHLRTFILLSHGADLIPDEIFLKLRYIRVLNLSCTNIRQLPDTIGTLRHLRYLNVSNTKIESLPESITNLYGLETIKLKNCFKFLNLPKDMRNLTNLRHLELDIKGQISSMPAQFGKLTSLETLSAFIVAKEEGQRIEELKDMRCLSGSICITNLENVTNNREAIKAKLDQKPYLDKVELEWKIPSDLAAPEVLGGLRPHNLIKELIITGYCGATFPNWLTSPSFCKLQSIYLHKCYKCTVLPFLGRLPMLNSLYIHDMPDLEIVDRNFTSSSISFPSLLTLRFNKMPKLEIWTDLTNGNLPKLCHLQIENCPILKLLPSLQCLTSLETLDISRCPEVQFLPDGELPNSLNSLIITECEILAGNFDFSTTRSISYVEVDGEIIQGPQDVN